MLSRINKYLLYISVVVFLFGSGYKLGEYKATFGRIDSSNASIFNTSSDKKEIQNLDFGLFWDTWNKLGEKYVDKKKIDPKKMFYGAIKGMVASLEDPYTFFLTPEENKQTKDDMGGKFEGIGATLGTKNNQVIVIAPLKNSPAEKAGIKAGDYITKVNGEVTKTWELAYAVSKIRGEKGSKVKLTIARADEGKEIDIEIVRDQIIVSSIELEYETKNNKPIAILTMSKFGDDTDADWDKAIDEIAQKYENKEVSGMVLDLRNNPGGYLQSAVYTAAEFIPINKLVVKQEYIDGKFEEYKTMRNGKLLDIPIVVLINQGSASASEILAGALRDYGRAKLIGMKSFGKGSIQEALDLKSGAGLHVTIAKWILPKGDWINGKGIEPNIQIENVVEKGNTLTRETDIQLEKAVQEVSK
jgi:carboxyl-terminal processing protease